MVSDIAAERTGDLRARALAHLCLPSLSALLLAGAFPPLEWSPLAWVALLPLCLVLVDEQSFLETYLSAYLGGLVFQMLSLDWLRTTYGGRGFSGENAMNWLMVSVLAGLLWPLLVAIGRRVARRNWPMFLGLPVLWTSYEFARKELWGLLIDETGTPWGQIGYTQAENFYLIQIADLGGVYAVTFLIAAVNGAIWDLLRASLGQRQVRVPLSALAGGALLLATALYGYWRVHQTQPLPGPTVTLMPSWTPGIAKSLPSSDRSDILLWSELNTDQTIWDLSQVQGLDPQRLDAEARALLEGDNAERDFVVTKLFEEQARELDATLVVGCERMALTPSGARKFNSLACIDPRRGYLGCYDKMFLVPWTEFTPHTLARALYGHKSRGYTRGTSSPIFTFGLGDHATAFAASICFDNCFSSFYRNAMRSQTRPAFFLHAGSEGQDLSYSLARNMFNMARFRAVESRRAMVRNTVHGYSGVIDSNGRSLVLLPEMLFTRPMPVGHIPIDNRTTFYVTCGDWLPLLCAALLMCISR